MSIVFSENTNNSGIVEQTRAFMRVDATQWPASNVVNSSNNWLDTITGYALLKDKRFNWDDSNHTALPIGTTNMVLGQSDYSFLVDEQGNEIITLLRIDIKDASGNWTKLAAKDEYEINVALDEFESTDGTPKYYDKIADNIIRLYPTPSANVTAGIKFYFQRTGSYFTVTDTTKAPGVSPLLHRGFIVASAYDGALTLGLNNFNALAAEMERERQKMITYFSVRNNDERRRITPNVENNR